MQTQTQKPEPHNKTKYPDYFKWLGNQVERCESRIFRNTCMTWEQKSHVRTCGFIYQSALPEVIQQTSDIAGGPLI